MDHIKISDFDYDLPTELIAQTPLERRDSSRLLVLNRSSGALEHRHFRDIGEYLHPGDLLIANQSRVIPARLLGHRATTGGAVEVLLLAERRDLGPHYWETLVRPARRLHEGDQVVFRDETNPNLTLHAEILRHGDLHALDVAAIPERRQEWIREPEEEHVVHRPLAQVVIDAKDRLLLEGAEQRAVERLGRGKVVAEGLFDDDSRPLGAARSGQLLDDRPEQRRGDGEVMRGPLGPAQLLTKVCEGGRVAIVAVDVAQESAQLVERRCVESAVLRHAVARTGAKLV